MTWLERIRDRPPQASSIADTDPSESASHERASPALQSLFDSLEEDGRHSVLDLGQAEESSFRILSGFARQIHFLGVVPRPPLGDALTEALSALRRQQHRYDVVLAWDVLDQLGETDRNTLMERIVEATTPSARLYAVVDASGTKMRPAVRSTLMDANRVSQMPLGEPEPAPPEFLPAQVEKALEPFEVIQAFSLRIGLREYLARKS